MAKQKEAEQKKPEIGSDEEEAESEVTESIVTESGVESEEEKPNPKGVNDIGMGINNKDKPLSKPSEAKTEKEDYQVIMN
mgnify:CR=1 FL=1